MWMQSSIVSNEELAAANLNEEGPGMDDKNTELKTADLTPADNLSSSNPHRANGNWLPTLTLLATKPDNQ